MSVLSSLLVAVGVDPSGVAKGLGEADGRIAGFANKMDRTGAGLTKGVTLPLIALGGFALKSAMTVDEAYDTIRVGTGATGKTLQGLEKSFDSVAKKTPADMAAVADTVADLNTRLGLTGPTLEKLSRQVLEAGRMAGVPVDVKNATAAFSVFDVTGKQTTAGMDDLFRVSQATGVGINDLTSIMAKSGGVLSQLGFNFAESASLIGVLDKAGINSRAVMSSMSAGLVKLAKDGEAPQAAFKRVTGEIQSLVKRGQDAKALDLAGQVFGTRGAGQFVAALKSGKVNLDDITKSAHTSRDSILGVANKTKDFPELWQQFKNQATLALAPLAADLMPRIASGLKTLSGHLQTAVAWWDSLSEKTKGRIFTGLTVAAAVGPSLMVVAKAVTLVNSAIAAGTAVHAAFSAAAVGTRIQLAALAIQQKVTAAATWLLNAAMAANPITLVVLALAALVAGLVIAYQKSETFRNIVNGAFGAVKDFVVGALDWIVEKAKAWGPYMLGALLGPVGLIVVGIVKHWDDIKAATSAAWGWVVDKVKAVPGLLWQAFLNFTLPGLIIKHWDDIKAGTSKAWNWVVDFVKGIPNRLLSFFLNWTLPGLIIKHWDQAKDGTVRVATGIVNWVADLPGRIVGKLSSLGGDLYETTTSAFVRMREGAEKKVAALIDYVGGIPMKVRLAIGDLSSTLYAAGRAIIGGLISGIVDKAKDLWNELKGITDKIPLHKGPPARDRNLLRHTGQMIMEGLIRGLTDRDGDLKSELGKITDLIGRVMDRRYKSDAAAEAATKAVIRGLGDERAALVLNARQHDRWLEKLDAARERLQSLKQEAREYANSVRDSIVSFANVTGFVNQETGTTTAADVVAGLQQKLLDAAAYSAGLQQLVAMGLNDTTIRQLEQAGVEGGLATVSALVEGGQGAVDQINALTGQLVAVGGNLGDQLSDSLYGAGIDAAQSLVDSLESKVAAIEKTGRKLARAFVRALEAELKKAHITIPDIDPGQVHARAYDTAQRATSAARAATAAPAPADRTDEVLAALGAIHQAQQETKETVAAQPYVERDVRRQTQGW